MTPTPKVSVLIPTYNYAHFLDETIQSVLNQTFTDFELIVVDNCSTDKSIEVVTKYLGDPRVKLFQNEKNLGLLGNWNKCLEYASGTYIKYLCADDKFEPELLEKFVQVMDENPTVSLVTSDKKIFDQMDKTITLPFRGLQDGKQMILHTLKRYAWIGEPSSVMFRRKDLHVGHFNSNYKFLIDWEMWIRLLSIGDCYIIPEPLVNIRYHQGQHTKEYDNKKFVIYFEEYFMVKDVIKFDKYGEALKVNPIDKLLKKKAINVVRYGVFKNMNRIYLKERRDAFKQAIRIAFKEHILMSSVFDIFITSRLRQMTKSKKLMA